MSLYYLLHQDDTWTDRDGVAHRIAEMEPRYCANVVGFLQRRAEGIAGEITHELIFMPLPADGTTAHDDIATALDCEIATLDDPLAWLNNTPLIKALQLRAAQGD